MKIRRLLIVEDDAALAGSLAAALEESATECVVCETAAAALAHVERDVPELMLLDLKLADGTAMDVLERSAGLSPRPAIIGMSGQAEPYEAFRLHELGVRAFLQKPLDLETVRLTVARVMTTPPDVLPQVRNVVGHLHLKDFEEQVRATFVNEALGRASFSRRAAAKLLGVTRQALQHILKR